ncbi:unnamed protein product [Lathyrus oleraceus]
MDTLRKPNLRFPYPTKVKYYLVDSGYPSLKGFLAPYKNARRTNSSDLDILESLEISMIYKTMSKISMKEMEMMYLLMVNGKLQLKLMLDILKK